MREIIIKDNDANQRFDKYLFKYLNKAPKSFVYKMLRKKNITLNGHKDDGSTIINKDDIVRIFICEESIVNFIDENILVRKTSNIRDNVTLDIVYEDENIIIINKPAGMLSQKAEANDVSANEYIIKYLLDNKRISGESIKTFTPSICNRLDRNTTGLLVAGKTLKGLQDMSHAFKERSLHKYYLCVVEGVVSKGMTIKGYLLKNEKSNKVTITEKETRGSSPIETEYIPLASNNSVTLMMINLITGKPHQIRAHLSYIKHPIIGDFKYGNNTTNKEYKKKYNIQSQLLHAYRLDLNSNLSVKAKPPKVFERLLKEEGINYDY